MENTIKIDKDQFVWKIVTDIAGALWETEAIDLYLLYDDDTEALITDDEEFDEAIKSGLPIGIEVGFVNYKEREELKELIDSHDFGYLYSDDGRVYAMGRAQKDRIRQLMEVVDKEVYLEWWNAKAPHDQQLKY